MLARGEYAEASDLLREILEFAPVEAKAWHMLGRALQQQGEHEEALHCFRRAESCYQGHSRTTATPASLRLAKMLWQQGECAEARAMLQALIAEKPGDTALQALLHEWGAEG